LFRSLLKSDKQKTPPSTSRTNSRALRPLLLPEIVSSEPERLISIPPAYRAEGFSALRISVFEDTELVPPLPRRQLPAFAGSGFRSPPSLPLSRAGSYVPRKASPLQKSHSLLPQPETSPPRSTEKEKTESASSLRVSTDSEPRSSALERLKGWARRLSCVIEDPRTDNHCRKEKQKAPVCADDDDDDWDFRCKGDPDEQVMQCTVWEAR